MKIFLWTHWVITQPQSYTWLIKEKWSSIIGYLFQIVLILTAAMAISHTITLTNSTDGIGTALSSIASDVYIKDGHLVVTDTNPVIPPPYSANKLYSLIINQRLVSTMYIDSLIIIDTTFTKWDNTLSQNTFLVLGKDSLYVFPTFNRKGISYAHLTPQHSLITFDKQAIDQFMHKNAVWFSLVLGVYYFFIVCGILFMCFSMLFFAAYMFSIKRNSSVIQKVRIALISLPPVMIALLIGAIVGNSTALLTQIGMIVSSIILFRGLKRIQNSTFEKER